MCGPPHCSHALQLLLLLLAASPRCFSLRQCLTAFCRHGQESHLQFLATTELLVELGDDLADYEDDVAANSFNVRSPPFVFSLLSLHLR